MNKELEKVVEHITEMQHKLYRSENNLQYIKRGSSDISSDTAIM